MKIKTKLTKRVVDQLQPADKDIIYWDPQLPGFGLKVTPAGRKTYVLQYRNQEGRTRRLTLGVHGAITTEQARRLAIEKLGLVASGKDPADEVKKSSTAVTVSDLADRFLRESRNKKKESSFRNDRQKIARIIKPRIGNIRVDRVERRHIAKIHNDLADTPYQANRVLALLSRMFNLAETWGYRPQNTNPCTGIQKYPEHERQRALNEEELQRLFQALDEEQLKRPDCLVVEAIRLILFTGARKNEILSLQWDYIDLEGGFARLPDTKTGPRKLPLNQLAVEVLQRIPRDPDSPYVFPSTSKSGHITELRPVWKNVRKAANLDDVRIHDLRHTFATIAARCGVSAMTLQAVLGHSEVRTTQRYTHLAGSDAVKQASETVGRAFASVNGDRPRPSRPKHQDIDSSLKRPDQVP